VAVVENSAADAQDHRPMTPDQGFKGNFFSTNQEEFEQLCVFQAIIVLQNGHAAKMFDDSAHGRGCHTDILDALESFSTNILPAPCCFRSIILRVSGLKLTKAA
jgi:hypothetical protein